MTSFEVERRLERMLSSTREATLPAADARARIRAALDVKLASAGPGVAPRSTPRWLGFGALALGLGAAGLFSWRGPRDVAPTKAAPALLQASAAPTAVSLPTPSGAAGEVEAPFDSRVVQPRSPVTRRTPAPASSVHAPSRSEADVADELSLVRDMQQALRAGDAARALALASEHERRFPGGTLVEEREGTRAIAGCRGADTAARSSIAEQFNRRFGASPYAARVKAACR